VLHQQHDGVIEYWSTGELELWSNGANVGRILREEYRRQKVKKEMQERWAQYTTQKPEHRIPEKPYEGRRTGGVYN